MKEEIYKSRNLTTLLIKFKHKYSSLIYKSRNLTTLLIAAWYVFSNWSTKVEI